MECDPGTFDAGKLRRLKDAGFNRVSLGAQSFDDGELERMGRCHTADDVRRALRDLDEVGGEGPVLRRCKNR